MHAKKIPATVITGFLGAGKTTLVNNLLAENSGSNIGVIVNEYGEVGIDGELIVVDEEALIEIRNGCVCCTVRTDLVAGVKVLLERKDISLNHLIIETSGLADPAPVLQTFLADSELYTKVEVQSVITIVDAANFDTHIQDEIAKEQISFADLILINKSDLVTSTEISGICDRLHRMNPSALKSQTINSLFSLFSAETVLGIQRFSIERLLEIEPGILEEEHEHEHDQSISAIAVETVHPIDPDRFNRWANRLVQEQGLNIMRMKGVLNFIGQGRQFYFHSVHMLLECKPGKKWSSDSERKSSIVFIGRNLDRSALQNGFLQCMTEVSDHSHA